MGLVVFTESYRDIRGPEGAKILVGKRALIIVRLVCC